jgi:hypothetical protein
MHRDLRIGLFRTAESQGADGSALAVSSAARNDSTLISVFEAKRHQVVSIGRRPAFMPTVAQPAVIVSRATSREPGNATEISCADASAEGAGAHGSLLRRRRWPRTGRYKCAQGTAMSLAYITTVTWARLTAALTFRALANPSLAVDLLRVAWRFGIGTGTSVFRSCRCRAELHAVAHVHGVTATKPRFRRRRT